MCWFADWVTLLSARYKYNKSFTVYVAFLILHAAVLAVHFVMIWDPFY